MGHSGRPVEKSNDVAWVMRVGSRGRAMLPHEVVTSLGWKPGDTLILTLDEKGHLTAEKRL